HGSTRVNGKACVSRKAIRTIETVDSTFAAYSFFTRIGLSKLHLGWRGDDPMAVWQDFKQFAFKGNVVDLAVGVVIGAAFGKIVTALVSDFIMPIVALAMPAGEWRENGIFLRQGATEKETVMLKYGDFLGTTLDFLIIA